MHSLHWRPNQEVLGLNQASANEWNADQHRLHGPEMGLNFKKSQIFPVPAIQSTGTQTGLLMKIHCGPGLCFKLPLMMMAFQQRIFRVPIF